MHKPCSEEGCSELLNQRQQAKLQWLQDPGEINGDNVNSSHFSNNKEGISERQNS
jgi:hypothetical protein